MWGLGDWVVGPCLAATPRASPAAPNRPLAPRPPQPRPRWVWVRAGRLTSVASGKDPPCREGTYGSDTAAADRAAIGRCNLGGTYGSRAAAAAEAGMGQTRVTVCNAGGGCCGIREDETGGHGGPTHHAQDISFDVRLEAEGALDVRVVVGGAAAAGWSRVYARGQLHQHRPE
jgi:hypothetical protein